MSRLVVASQLNEAFNTTFAEQLPDVEIVGVPAGTPAALPRDAQVLIAAPFRKAGGSLPLSPPPGWPFNVKWVQLVSVGIDFYPDWLFDGPAVTSARGSSAVALAEFALAAIFAEAKRLPEIWIDRFEQWAPTPLTLVAGKTLGLVGFGAIGEALAPRARALGLNVVAVRRSSRPIEAPGVEQLHDLGELFERSDFVVLAAPATPETVGLVGREVLARAKPGLHLINIARGALIDDDALLEALDDGRVARASLDVTHPEPLPFNHRYYSHPKVRLSPHTSVHTPDTRRNLAAQFAANLARFRDGAPLADLVDTARGY
ncbi:D-isomer specific 2-hydroxyacid dehydrogenase family protein [Phenylobacterium sp.]|uniref:D-isomer specific 2-hydroxyacid dehydrogenase family protein n=1 Tax=Phenylobacterium sp. TaxID=1871053 RepID=UPI0028A19EDF|nr:D-isomer specific 2-hydroxyacid dehydrogenase family protein [Phenylobacterium sp.]